MRVVKKCWLIIPLLFVAGCVSTRQFVVMPEPAGAVENTGKARIYVLRTSYIEYHMPVKIYDNEQMIGELGRGKYLCWERDPGEVKLLSKTYNFDDVAVRDRLDLTVEAGKTYYLWLKPRMGFLFIFLAHNYITILDDASGAKKLSKCKPAKYIKAQ